MPTLSSKLLEIVFLYFVYILGKGDNKTIGIILCANKDNIVAEYRMDGISNNLFAANYTYCIPNQEELIAQVVQVIRENELCEM